MNEHIDFIKRLFKIQRHIGPEETDMLIRSMAGHQFESKERLFELLEVVDFNDVGILGCWTCSVMGLHLLDKKVTGYDMDQAAIDLGRQLFPTFEFKHKDVFEMKPEFVRDHDLIINTSCEHMPPMSKWPYWRELQKGTYVAFQSNNMFHLEEEHINCVSSAEEFIKQMPHFVQILAKDTYKMDNGYERYTLVGIVC